MKYFLEAVIPTAEKWKVQLACHLCGPHPATTRARTIAPLTPCFAVSSPYL